MMFATITVAKKPMESSSPLSAAGLAARAQFWFAASAWLLFALLAGVLTLRHVLWFDEVQAWLIVRDSPTLAALFHNLHYEGHPALWYLLLYPLPRLTTNPAAMQALNYLLALIFAALILTAPRLRPLPAVLIVFSSILFNEYSTYARSYLLAALLLIAALRLLLAARPRPLLAFLCLGLAINTHFLTVPIALVLAAWFVGSGYGSSERRWFERLTSRTTLLAAAILAVSLLACYLTVRPAADILPLNVNQPSALGHFFFVEGRVWRIFFRIPIAHLPLHLIDRLDPKSAPSALASVLSALTLLLTLAALRTRAARIFFAAAFVASLAVLAAVTLTPEIRHYGFLWVAFIAAVLIDASQADAAPAAAVHSASARVARVALTLILVQQCLLSFSVSAKEWKHPISGSLQTARWIRAQGLDANPMLMEPYDGPNALLGYLNKPRAWFPACHCFGSFARRAVGIDLARPATPVDLAAARAGSALPVVLVANFPLDPTTQQTLGVEFLFASSPAALKPNDNFFVYRERSQP
jgi:hypothetical protein